MAEVTGTQRLQGFTLVEVLVALAMVAVALMAGLRATGSVTRQAQRQSNVLLAQLCAENQLVNLRLAKRLPDVGDTQIACEQAGLPLAVTLAVRPTPNPNFRRVDAQVFLQDSLVLSLSTIVGNLP